jgi:hypothetical protein
MKSSFVSVIAAALAVLPVSAGLLFNNGGPNPEAGAVASNFAGHDPEYEIQSADDFVLASPATLTQVRWWGAYQGSNVPLNPDVFTIRIFADAGGQPAATALAEERPVRVRRSATGVTTASLDIYEYVAQFKPHLELPAGVYWLSIVNDVLVEETATDWLWVLNDLSAGNYAFRFNDGSAWESVHPFTLAFEIYGINGR